MKFCIDSNIPYLKEVLTTNYSEGSNKNVVSTFESGSITNKRLKDEHPDFLIVRSTAKVNEELLEGTNIKYIATATTGIDHFDIEYLNNEKINYFAAEGANSNSVAEYVIFAILYYGLYASLKDKVVGIIGYGNIGKKVAYYLKAMNIKHFICDPFINNEKFIDVDSIIKQCNIITTHTPLTYSGKEPTFDLLNAARINAMKDNTLIISTARGKICNEAAMLENRARLCYATDVWEGEPAIKNKELLNLSLLSTPHIAGHSIDGKLNATKMILKWIEGIVGVKFDLTMIPKNENTEIYLNEKMKDYNYLFEMLLNSRDLLALSLEMKSAVAIYGDNFAEYFKKTRANYPKKWEILSVNKE